MPCPFTTLFVDVGGVLLTNAWDHIARHRATEHFALDQEALERRHHFVFSLCEEGKLSLDEYLDRTVFHENRETPWPRWVCPPERITCRQSPPRREQATR